MIRRYLLPVLALLLIGWAIYRVYSTQRQATCIRA